MIDEVNPNPLAPARSRAEWEAQGWAVEPEPIGAAARLEATLSIRFDPDGASLLQRAARLKGLTKSQFVRLATLQAARQAIAETPLPATARVIRNKEHAATTGSGASPDTPSDTTTEWVIDLTT